MKKSIKLTAVTAVAALTLGMGASAFAEDIQGGPMGGPNGPGGFGGPGGPGNFGGPKGGPKGGMHKGGPMGGPVHGGIDGVSAVLAELVKAGTITQAQSDAISKALVNAPAAARAAAKAQKAAHEKLISDTVGLAWADIQTRLTAGETLAAIAGAKKDALIAALVKEATDRIAADVAAGRATEAQATERQTGLTERIIADISSIHKGPGLKGKGSKTTLTKPTPAPSATTSASATNAKSKAKAVVKQVKTVTTKKSA
jgi:hypothetical protein